MIVQNCPITYNLLGISVELSNSGHREASICVLAAPHWVRGVIDPCICDPLRAVADAVATVVVVTDLSPRNRGVIMVKVRLLNTTALVPLAVTLGVLGTPAAAQTPEPVVPGGDPCQAPSDRRDASLNCPPAETSSESIAQQSEAPST